MTRVVERWLWGKEMNAWPSYMPTTSWRRERHENKLHIIERCKCQKKKRKKKREEERAANNKKVYGWIKTSNIKLKFQGPISVSLKSSLLREGTEGWLFKTGLDKTLDTRCTHHPSLAPGRWAEQVLIVFPVWWLQGTLCFSGLKTIPKNMETHETHFGRLDDD